ncbi:MAG: hypothetical protein LBD94_00870 [Rickettsiales bacterium]|jgi:hypothetical protein|nr:hypothetical protein [Rickettsiales bacterium]
MNAVDNFVQCWGCPIFDRLFQIISAAGAAIYEQMVSWAWIVLVAFWVFYALYVVYLNFKSKDQKDWLYQDSVKPVLINSLVVCVLLGMGVAFPKIISSITFEPVAEVTNLYAQSVLQTDASLVEQRVSYQAQPMGDDGFFRPELRDKIISLMKTTISQFQVMIKLGLAVMENAFSLKALLGIGALLKHILMFMMGAYLAYEFFRLFMRFCFYFVDVIVALMMFAFFFPFMLVFFVFKNSSGAEWVKKMGNAFSPTLIKDVINAICALAVAIIAYTIVMVIVAKFFSSDAMSSNEIIKHILAGTVSPDILSDENLVNLTLMGCIIIGFLVNYLTNAKQIKSIGGDIFAVFGAKPEAKLGEDIADKVATVAKNLADGAAGKIKALMSDKNDENKDGKEDSKKDNKEKTP